MNMLLTQEIPSARQALLDSHDSLKKVASYCAQKYIAVSNLKKIFVCWYFFIDLKFK